MLRGPEAATVRQVRHFLRTSGSAVRCKIMKNWGVIGGIAAAFAAGFYVLWGPITDRKKHRKGLVPGLLNLGNTCFINSLLQGLSACPSFIKWLETFTAPFSTEQNLDAEPQYLSLTLLRLLKALCNQETADSEILDASRLLEVLRMYRWQISSSEEQDAHELFHVLTSSLEDERDHRPRVAHLFDMVSLEQQPEISEKPMSCRSRGVLHPMPTHWKFQHPFHGRLTNNMICKRCEHQNPVRYDSFDSLSLSIPGPVWGRPLTLDHCLQHFISSESVKDVICENCTKIRPRAGRLGLYRQRDGPVLCERTGEHPFSRPLPSGNSAVGLGPGPQDLSQHCPRPGHPELRSRLSFRDSSEYHFS